jgi:hypothetical protein
MKSQYKARRWLIPLLGGLFTVVSLCRSSAGEQQADYAGYTGIQCHDASTNRTTNGGVTIVAYTSDGFSTMCQYAPLGGNATSAVPFKGQCPYTEWGYMMIYGMKTYSGPTNKTAEWDTAYCKGTPG